MIRDNEWLVVIDRQKVFAESDWSTWAVPDHSYDTTTENYRRLAEAFGDRVAYTRYVSPEPPEDAWADYFADWPDFIVPKDHPMFDWTDDTAPLVEGHPVVTKTVFSKWGPELADVIRGAKKITVCGVATDFCVLQTALAACDAGISVRVAADASAGTSPENAKLACDLMSLYAPLITVTDTDSILK
ncbi:cysteine hydrolase family protein [Bifidobacterium choloepi]|uniref:Cysteine hydrolase n=1 Tax=Bifidobacterium choloepi TaxID=2614131 RepID=A0A6I5MZT8_9BIFI|nr:cysteine hydrolase [Bifidobacterium choloepi]NEG69777.1 cysteine hydrolase [Bifidobacterium choloepi]